MNPAGFLFGWMYPFGVVLFTTLPDGITQPMLAMTPRCAVFLLGRSTLTTERDTWKSHARKFP